MAAILDRKDEVEVEVNWEDQKMINSFSWLNLRLHEIEAEIEKKKEEAQVLEDAGGEVVFSEDDVIKVGFGRLFFLTNREEAERIIEEKKAKTAEKIVELESELATIKQTIADTKVHLYGKFKNSINLEED